MISKRVSRSQTILGLEPLRPAQGTSQLDLRAQHGEQAAVVHGFSM